MELFTIVAIFVQFLQYMANSKMYELLFLFFVLTFWKSTNHSLGDVNSTANALFDEFDRNNHQKGVYLFFLLVAGYRFKGKPITNLLKNPKFIQSFLRNVLPTGIPNIFNEPDFSQKLTGYKDKVRYTGDEVHGKSKLLGHLQMTPFEQQSSTNHNLEISWPKVRSGWAETDHTTRHYRLEIMHIIGKYYFNYYLDILRLNSLMKRTVPSICVFRSG